jgi:superoxide dismutase, Fe-Mn family
MRFELPDLPYELNSLEPYISGMTLEIHHRKIHQDYVTNLNKLVPGTKFDNIDLETIIKVADGPVFYNAAQVWNHTFYFEGLKPGYNILKGPFAEIIKNNFGSIAFFKNTFTKTALSLTGVGWVWLVLNQYGLLELIQEKNAGNPLRNGIVPIMNCDLWEHAYYLDYHSNRQDYLEAFLKLINWEIIEKRYKEFFETDV